MILTTNRIGVFDEAIPSHILLPLYFPPLNQTTTILLWEQSIDRLAQRPDFEVDRDSILDFAKTHFQADKFRLNGRQLRNTITAAVAFAKYEAEQYQNSQRRDIYLTERHFELITKTKEDFAKYTSEV